MMMLKKQTDTMRGLCQMGCVGGGDGSKLRLYIQVRSKETDLSSVALRFVGSDPTAVIWYRCIGSGA